MRKALTAFALALSAPVAAANTVSVCVFDVIGANGDVFNLMKDYALDVKSIGIDLNLKPYTDESVAIGDFNAGQCDAVAATDLRIRPYNRFTGSVSAVGALPTYDDLKTLLATLAQDKAAPLMKSDGYEVLGILPIGAGYLFTSDRSIDSAAELAGKRMATLDYQKDAIHMVNYVKATVVPSDITNFAGKFNNGSVDTAYAPAFAYEALELYKGLDPDGGIVNYTLAQLTVQIIVRDELIEDDIAQQARQIAWSMFPQTMDLVAQQESAIPNDKWIEISAEDKEGYQEMFRQNRIEMRDGSNGAPTVYDPRMLTLMANIRCSSNPGASECTASDRE
ncbi:MAG: putative solute-binding protein [Marinobacter sp.]|uniref:putative solute-binding protein n=1 Tax=Marinobacter sp. TaxID=50741 RepID=UPI00299E4CB3|nr:putative solute-binding protein [Marinobacter sp.]MDX1755097.1 putative solute-binding protein [Marinobacter sp.]